MVTSDSSVGAGNRRVEALVGIEGFEYLARERDIVQQLTGLLKATPNDLPGQVQKLLERVKLTEKELEKIKAAELVGAAGDIASGAADVDGVALVTHRAEGISAGDVRSLALDVRGRLQGRPAVVIVVGTVDGKPSVVVALNEQALDRGLAANDLIGVIGEHIGGRGGGKADVAQGGGSDVAGIDAGFDAVRNAVARSV